MAGEAPEHFDVLIIGAGISGISAGYHLQDRRPHKSYAILESRERLGGTWDVFRYPGIRCDSDMYTLGYSFKPWAGKQSIVDGASILEYLQQAASESGVDERIRYGRRVAQADWSSADMRWTIKVNRTDSGETEHLTCDFLMVCSGHYSHDEGHMPAFKGVERFAGPVVHAQQWPEDLDYAGKRVIVIGSGATAVTMVPALAKKAAHVSMLQRSPSYVIAAPSVDVVASALQRLLPERVAYTLTRWKNVIFGTSLFEICRRRPKLMRWVFRKGVERQLPKGYDVDTHFNPRYDPWTQRICVAPDGDFFEAISDGRVSVVTDQIASFTERGIELTSGGELEADMVVAATGLKVTFGGGVRLAIDGEEINPGRTMAYKGTMMDGVPNCAFTVGYSNISWTLRADLVSEYVCRLLDHMDANGYRRCEPAMPAPTVTERPLFDLTSNFVLRGVEFFPSQGSTDPWRVKRYPADARQMRRDPIDDGMLRFSAEPVASRQVETLPT